MIKKIILISIFCSLLFSCGKKEDPTYKAYKNKISIREI
jgi:DNA-directed RNA polymerase subunit N (RpoN/RPB10)